MVNIGFETPTPARTLTQVKVLFDNADGFAQFLLADASAVICFSI